MSEQEQAAFTAAMTALNDIAAALKSGFAGEFWCETGEAIVEAAERIEVATKPFRKEDAE